MQDRTGLTVFLVRVVFVLFETRRFCKVARFVFPDLYDLYTCGIMVCFSAILLYYIELNVQLEDFKTFVTGFGGQ